MNTKKKIAKKAPSKKVAKRAAPTKTAKKSSTKKTAKAPAKKTAASLLSKSSKAKNVFSFFVETLQKGADRWVKRPDYPDDWMSEITKNRNLNLSKLDTLEIPDEVKSLLAICIAKSIRIAEIVTDTMSFALEVDYEGCPTKKEVQFNNLEDEFEVVDSNHDDSDYKRYDYTDVIHFKRHNVLIEEISEGVKENPPYYLGYSLPQPKKRVAKRVAKR